MVEELPEICTQLSTGSESVLGFGFKQHCRTPFLDSSRYARRLLPASDPSHPYPRGGGLRTIRRPCNAGSSSLKFSFFDSENEMLLAEGGIDWLTRLVFHRAGQPEIREELKLANYESGLLGVSGISSDMRQVLSELPNNPMTRIRTVEAGLAMSASGLQVSLAVDPAPDLDT